MLLMQFEEHYSLVACLPMLLLYEANRPDAKLCARLCSSCIEAVLGVCAFVAVVF